MMGEASANNPSVFCTGSSEIHRIFVLFIRFASFRSTKAHVEGSLYADSGHKCIRSDDFEKKYSGERIDRE